MIKDSLAKTIPPSERPRERCLNAGPTCLSLRECLALILGTGPPHLGCMGLATKILERSGVGMDVSEEERAFFTAMEVSSSAHLQGISGLGPAGQARLLVAFELGRRYSRFRSQIHRQSHQRKSPCPTLAHEALMRVPLKTRSEPQEWLGFVPLYRTGLTGELCIVEKGSRTHVNIDPAELFARILALRPQGFFLFHNHPSGNMTPSSQDLDLTEKVGKISKQLGIQLLGHWIVSSESDHWIQTCFNSSYSSKGGIF